MKHIHMQMGVLAPETWFVNKTENTMVLVTEDEFGVHVGTELIEPGGHVDVGYRKGIDRIGGKIHFWVHPKNRPDLRGPKIMPIDVYDYADIDVVYKLGGFVSGRYRIGALVGFEFKKDTVFRRIGLVRWCDGACASLASLGNCYYTPATAPSPVPVHVQAVAPEIETVINGSLGVRRETGIFLYPISEPCRENGVTRILGLVCTGWHGVVWFAPDHAFIYVFRTSSSFSSNSTL